MQLSFIARIRGNLWAKVASLKQKAVTNFAKQQRKKTIIPLGKLLSLQVGGKEESLSSGQSREMAFDRQHRADQSKQCAHAEQETDGSYAGRRQPEFRRVQAGEIGNRYIQR